MNHPAKLDANRTYRFQVIQLLVKLMFSSAAILDFKNDIFLASGCLGCSKLNIPAEFGAFRTYRYDAIHFFIVKFTLSLAAILDYEKISYLTLLLSGRCLAEAPCQIWRESDQRFGSYSVFFLNF